mmetsp:Transcript_22693/g.63332  ORF Transcript_22693/g.63332 Transcript_22693/m.63332 type:complete len:233 (-) Transcript_22693:309-1007(-)
MATSLKRRRRAQPLFPQPEHSRLQLQKGLQDESARRHSNRCNHDGGLRDCSETNRWPSRIRHLIKSHGVDGLLKKRGLVEDIIDEGRSERALLYLIGSGLLLCVGMEDGVVESRDWSILDVELVFASYAGRVGLGNEVVHDIVGGGLQHLEALVGDVVIHLHEATFVELQGDGVRCVNVGIHGFLASVVDGVSHRCDSEVSWCAFQSEVRTAWCIGLAGECVRSKVEVLLAA